MLAVVVVVVVVAEDPRVIGAPMAAMAAVVVPAVQVLAVTLRRAPLNLSLAMTETPVRIPIREPSPLPAGGVPHSTLRGAQATGVTEGMVGVPTFALLAAAGHTKVPKGQMEPREGWPLSFCLLNVDDFIYSEKTKEPTRLPCFFFTGLAMFG